MTTRRQDRRGSAARSSAALVGLLLASGCAADGADVDDVSADASRDLQPVTLMLNWTPNAHHLGIYAAEEMGWFEKAGIDLTIIEPVDTGVEQAVAAGAADFGIAQAESLLPARAADVPVVSVATLLPVNDSALFALEEAGITRPRDLEGTRYGGFGGALETEIIAALMRCDDADADAVDFVTIGNVDYVVGMQQDEFDTAWVFSGWDALRAEEVEGVAVSQIRFSDYDDCVPNWYTPLLLAAEDGIESPLAEDFVAVVGRGYAFAADDPAGAAAAMLAQVPELDEELLSAAADYYASRFTTDSEPWGWQDTTTWKEFAAFLRASEVMGEEVDATAAFTNELVASQ